MKRPERAIERGVLKGITREQFASVRAVPNADRSCMEFRCEPKRAPSPARGTSAKSEGAAATEASAS